MDAPGCEDILSFLDRPSVSRLKCCPGSCHLSTFITRYVTKLFKLSLPVDDVYYRIQVLQTVDRPITVPETFLLFFLRINIMHAYSRMD